MANDVETGIGLADRHPQVRVILVVAKENVETRLMGLDEAVLEDQCLALGVGDDYLDVLNSLDEPVELRRIDASVLKVRPDPTSQRTSFADVQDLSALAPKEIHARRSRKLIEFLFEQ
jgi:hypothetical protein